jgi:hypothetical protein
MFWGFVRDYFAILAGVRGRRPAWDESLLCRMRRCLLSSQCRIIEPVEDDEGCLVTLLAKMSDKVK